MHNLSIVSRGLWSRSRKEKRELVRIYRTMRYIRHTRRQRKARQWNALCEMAQQTCRRHAALVDCDRRRRRRLYCGSCCSPLSEIIVEKPIRRGCRVSLPVTVEELQPISTVEGHPWGISAVRWNRDLQWKVRHVLIAGDYDDANPPRPVSRERDALISWIYRL